MFNAGAEAANFGLPPLPSGDRWHLAVDTSGPTPQNLSAPVEQIVLNDCSKYHIEARSAVILLTRKQESTSGGASV
jgi:isoamylase